MVNGLEKHDPIIDAFLFNGEQNLLKLRIKYLENFVDKFVIGQSKLTFSNKPKEIIKIDLKALDLDSLDKKIEFVTLESVKSEDFWEIERSQRASLLKHVKQNYPNHSVLYCDVDEIPSIDQIAEFLNARVNIYSVPMKMTYLFANTVINNRVGFWKLPKAIKAEILQEKNLDLGRIRELECESLLSSSIGCHFSYFLPSEEVIRKKFVSFSHNEFDFENSDNAQLIDIAKKYAISPLGDFDHNHFGLLKIEKAARTNSVQRFVAGYYPLSFKQSKARIYPLRLYHSFQISQYQKSRGHWILKNEIEIKRLSAFIQHLLSLLIAKIERRTKSLLRGCVTTVNRHSIRNRI